MSYTTTTTATFQLPIGQLLAVRCELNSGAVVTIESKSGPNAPGVGNALSVSRFR